MVVGAYGAKQKGEICEAPYLCETVDECCFEMTCECFNRLRFNEEVCDGWDLYAVEMCLRGKDNGTRGGRGDTTPESSISRVEMLAQTT